MEGVMDRPRDFTRDECLGLMDTVSIGRVVFTEQALPAVMPVAFVIDDGDAVICVPSESNLSAVTRGAIVAFEVDALDAAAPAGWAITVIGRARVDRDPGERVRQALQAWATGPQTEFIRISCQRLAGRRIWPSHIGDDHAAA
ncbi:pyridoxamine 5'-phosphate oxidase family protein [Actinomadura chokoriensis]|jgi:nitroimidazol reductase NimA-like FMN-containing flavoprotein (pyridoxamine 5'-phosphate oxidase superfamily)|uniref:pyridoxamine 5'-phosphate oxidase family protein n=1 Tax=Actinomadura chokoriensis TaxID=454156 RepID=UPI0031FA2620